MNPNDIIPDFINATHRKSDVHLIREVMWTQQAILASFSPQVGLSASLLALIRQLAMSGPDGAGVTQLAEALAVNIAAVTRHVQYLQRQGWVTRWRDSKDRRRSYIRLSAKGVAIFEKAHQRSHEFERAITRRIGVEKIKIAADVLRQVREAIESGEGVFK